MNTLDIPVSPAPAIPDTHSLSSGIIYFGNDWFGENRTSSHHIARCLSARFPMLYVEAPGLRTPQATSRDVTKLWKKLRLAFQPPRQIGDQMWHISVPQIPYRRFAVMRALNRYFGQLMVRSAARKLGILKPALWFHVPHMSHLVGHLAEQAVIYYCIDNYSALPGVAADHIRQMDQDLTRRADHLFVSSRPLLEAKRNENPTATYSPHGVDVELFRRASDDPSLPVAERVRDLRHPVIGFFGLIEGWIDLNLIAYLARTRPDWTFLFVGRIAVELGELANLSNVIFVGPQPYQTLPSWAKAFDVAIYPALLNEFVRNANPLKIREYLATGKPVVSVRSKEVESFKDHVLIADNYQDFASCIEQALTTETEDRRRSRQAAVSTMTWEARVDQVIQLIAQRRTAASAERRHGEHQNPAAVTSI